MSNPAASSPLAPRICRAPITELLIYDVSEAELEAIERGGPESLMLNFAILFLSTGISFTVTLATTDIKSIYVYNGFFIVTAVSYAGAIVLGTIWGWSLRSKKRVISNIRGRRPPVGEPLPAAMIPA